MSAIGKVVRTWNESEWRLLCTFDKAGANFRMSENVYRMSKDELGLNVYNFVVPANNETEGWAITGQVVAIYQDRVAVDFGDRYLHEFPSDSKFDEFMIYRGAALRCQHNPVDTGMLMGWCRHCNQTMTFNRQTGKYEV